MRLKRGPKVTGRSISEIDKLNKIYLAERHYNSLPLQNIPELKKYDHSDNSNWKKLPLLITV